VGFYLKKTIPLVILLAAVSCRDEGTSPEKKSASTRAPQLNIQNNRGLLFTYFDFRAEMKTVDSIEHVPKLVRADVMVINPAQRLKGDRIYVADLSKKNEKGNYSNRVERRGEWLARVMPKTSRLKVGVKLAVNQSAATDQQTRAAPLKAESKRSRLRRQKRSRSSRQTARKTARKTTRKKAPTKVAVVTPKQSMPHLPALGTSPAETTKTNTKPSTAAPKTRRGGVVLFGTGWCGSCKAARRYFLARKIPFRDLDVEKDAEGGRYYAAVVKRAGLRPGVVPVILIGSRVLQGFSAFQVGSALAQMAAKSTAANSGG
jgi:glutaredoxin